MSDPPAWWVQYLATVARETGWSEGYIMWQLPYAVGLGIEHAAGIFHGETMQLVDGSGAGLLGEREAMRDDLEAVRRRYRAEAGEDLTE